MRVIQVLIIIMISHLFLIAAYSQSDSSTLSYPIPEKVISEALRQALVLKRLPDVELLTDEDTIYFETYADLGGACDPIPLSVMPKRVGRWVLGSWDLLPEKSRPTFPMYSTIMVYVKLEDSSLMVRLEIQIHNVSMLSDGALLCYFKEKKGVYILDRIVKGTR